MATKETGKRIFAKFRDEDGHQLIKQCASTIIRDLDSDNEVVFQGNGACLEILQRSGSILEADEDFEVHAFKDKRHHRRRRELIYSEVVPWGIEAIQADLLDAGDGEVLVCIVDTGLAIDHPEFVDYTKRITGDDAKRGWEWDVDRFGHGTHTTGIIAATSGNDHGITGAGNFDLHIARSLDDYGRGYETDIRAAIEHCVAANSTIINMSLGGTYCSTSMKNFYTRVVEEEGIMIVAAAGNNGDDRKNFPAAHPSVISVNGKGSFLSFAACTFIY